MRATYGLKNVSELFLKGDIAIIIACTILVIIAFFITSQPRYARTYLFIKTDTEEYVYDLDQSAALELSGPLGITSVLIEDGGVQVMSSPGRQQLCVIKGKITDINEWLICLPNRVFIRIQSKSERQLDATIDSISY